MRENILRSSSYSKIFLTYIDAGKKNRYEVKFRFMDNKEAFFAAPMGLTFKEPRKKITVELCVYTEDGVYKTTVMLRDTTTSVNEILFQVTVPLQWNFIQMRSSTRVEAAVKFKIKYNDGFEINGVTHDLSLGGISFYSKEQISSIYKKLTGALTLEFPSEAMINLPGGKLVKEAKFCREKVLDGYEAEEFGNLFVYKLLFLTPDEQEELKHFLISSM